MSGVLLKAFGVAAVLLVSLPLSAAGQTMRGVIVDQTGLPLPGATIEVLNEDRVLLTLISGPEGRFEFPEGPPGTTVVVKLEGFEAVTVPQAEAVRIVLPIARASATTDVVAPTLPGDSAVAPLLGSSLSAPDLARLPSTHLKARESLPLLPSVVRGEDGLLRLGGARPSESPLLLDGFDITDPATGLSSINLPFEAVQGIEVLRDPVSVTYGDLLGGLVQLQSRPGGDKTTFGVQGFIPRPRFSNPGFGRIEGVFPRAYFGGSTRSGRFRYFSATEYDFERIPAPDVTQGSGPNIVEKSTTVFGRVDFQATQRAQWVFEALAFPSTTDSLGLSVRREDPATPDISARDLFAGVTHRYVLDPSTVLTFRVGVLSHNSRQVPHGDGMSGLSSLGWRRNWFATIERRAIRYTATAVWQRVIAGNRGTHDLTVTGSLQARRLRGTVSETAVMVEDETGRIVRRVDFAGVSSFAAKDRPHAFAVRDAWTVNSRFQFEAGARIDRNASYGGTLGSARGGVRYALDESGLTVLKASVGRFVGGVPLVVPAFSDFPVRIDRRLNRASGQMTSMLFRPGIDQLRLPRAVAVTTQIERQLLPNLDFQIGYTRRRSSALPTLDVPARSGLLLVRSNGRSSYGEAQVSVRRLWDNQQQLFVSYVRSSSRGELNDFGGLFQRLDSPLLQPQGVARLSADAKHRVIAWGTVNVPAKVVVSPVAEWHSGFPYSRVDDQYLNVGAPHSAAFPQFMALDLVVYRTFTFRGRMADLGMQLFNATNHFNPRDVHPVVDSTGTGKFTNSVGPILRGYMMIKW